MNSLDSLLLSTHFDCVVMLTMSNWHTEMRSNRYHYATRFAQRLPVIFIQPDLAEETYEYESTEIDNLVILHVFREYGVKQRDLINEALLSRYFIKPLLWVYNYLFVDFIRYRYTPFVVYHATEDYFSPDFKIGFDEEETQRHRRKLIQVLAYTDLLVAVSPGVLDNYLIKGNYSNDYILLPNGCDFDFWKPETIPLSSNGDKRVVLYQGSIYHKLDFELLKVLLIELPEWEFWFCGYLYPDQTGWEEINRYENLKYLGKLSAEQVREVTHQATVGIIPFVQNDLMIDRSWPLKAFEYVAAGLPVVSVPIKSLLDFPEVFHFAQSPQEFVACIEQAAPSRYDQEAMQTRLKIAQEQDYNKRFVTLASKINDLVTSKPTNQKSLKILILYDSFSTHITTVFEYLSSFAQYSQHHIFYAVGITQAECLLDLSMVFDVVMIHYAVRLSLDWHISPSYVEALHKFGGYKILFIQDEYECTETARGWIQSLGLHAVFTCVPDQYREQIYPSSRFPYVEFIQVLTGYVPLRYEMVKTVKPLAERKYTIGYRGRSLGYWYGDLAREKLIIAQRMREICDERNIVANIEWESDKRIYGDAWYEFIENCKATLATESGSNIFDEYGELQKAVEAALEQDPSLSYEEIHAKYLAEHEGKVKMNQISPRLFEAIAYKTALVLFEGAYSGIVQPNLHFIPLKKDFSNIDEVLDKLNNNEYLQTMTDRAYQDIVQSGKYNYKSFVQQVDKFISERVVKRDDISPLVTLIGGYPYFAANSQIYADNTVPLRSLPTNLPLPDAQIVTFDAQKAISPMPQQIISQTSQTNTVSMDRVQEPNSNEILLAGWANERAALYADRHAERVIMNAERKKWFLLIAIMFLGGITVLGLVSVMFYSFLLNSGTG